MRGQLKLSIEGMHCGSCIRRVTTALQGVKGVELGLVEVGLAQMAFDSNQASATEIAAAIHHIGFSTRIEK